MHAPTTVSETVPGADTTARPSRSSGWRALQIGLVLLPLVVLAIAAWRYRWVSDDGFINLRVVRQILAGNGPVFNRGERVEASTSPLWVAVLTLSDLVLPLRLEWVAVMVGIGTTIAGVALLMGGSARLQPPPAPDTPAGTAATLVIPTGVWLLVAFTPFWKFASSGLENGLFAVWFGASFLLLARWASTTRPLPPLWAAAIVGLGPLVRPDVALLSGCFLLAVIVTSKASWRAILGFLAAALAAPVLYQIFRMGYYDALVPNTAIAKEASMSWWSKGGPYVRDAGQPYWLWLPLLAVAIGGFLPMLRTQLARHDRRRLAITLACIAGGVAHLVYVARVGGDFMHARMVLPGLTAIVAPVAVTRFERRPIHGVVWLTAAMTVIVLGWALVATSFLRSKDDAPVAFIESPNAVTVEDLGYQPGGPARTWDTGPGIYFEGSKIDAPPHPGLPRMAIASYGIGVNSYALGTDVYVLDMLGLADPLTAHLRLDRHGTAPGHEKPLPVPWTAARLTAADAQVTEADFPQPGFLPIRALDDPKDPFAQRVADARTALQCEGVRELMERTTGSLSAKKFTSNLWHSFSDTRLRVPAEPSDAVAKFCS